MVLYRKEISLNDHKRFVVTLNDRTLTSTYVSNRPALNISKYVLKLRVDLTEDAFHDCVFDAVALFVKLKKKGQKKVHPLFVKLLIIAIAKATNVPLHYVVEKAEKETELAYRQPRHVTLDREEFLKDAYEIRKRAEELEAQA